MNATKNSSLLVILISASQLIVMLVIVGFIYSNAQSQMMEQAKDQLFQENHRILAHSETQLETLPGRSVAHEQRLLADVQQSLSKTPLPGERFFLLVDPRTCQVYENQMIGQTQVSTAQIITKDGTKLTLGKLVTKPSLPQSGEITLDGDRYFFSGRLVKSIDGYVIICEESEAVLAHINAMVQPLKKTAFGIFLLVGLVGFCITVLILQRYDAHLQEVNQSLEEKVIARTDDLLTTQKAVIYGLAKLAESRDNDTGDHLARIQLYVTILARSLMKYHQEIDEDYIKNLSLASSLHDIGKVGVPDAILLKQGRLTTAERGIMELHTVIGGDCLSSIQSQLGGNDFLEMARQIAYYHHERWDGSGYPRGRSEEEIPLCARIVSVADVYDALRTKRPYKQPLPHQQSREIILSGIGTQFDPEVVNAFLENEDQFEQISAECSKMTAAEVTPKIKILSEMITTG